jgi:hypothetical protein
MSRLISSVAFSALLFACDSQPGIVVTPTAPTPVVPFSGHSLARGASTEIRGTFQSVPLIFTIRPASDGTAVGRLTWDPALSGAKLKLTLDEAAFYAEAPNWSPVVGRLDVLAGQIYRIGVDEGFSPWDYHFNDPFVLTISLE